MSKLLETEIGKVPDQWNVLHIGDIGDVTKLAGFEYTKHFAYVDDGEIIALRALNVREGNLDLSDVRRVHKEVSESLPRSKLFKDDILFTYVGANIGQFALVPEDDKFHLAPNICRVRCKKEYLPYFLYSYFRTNTFRESLEGFSHGSSQPTLPMGIIRKIPVPVPPLEEQKAIAAVLSSLDDKIDLLHRQNHTLEAMAETLFRQWFIEEAQKDWEEVPITDLFEIRDGTHDSPKQTTSGRPLITSKHILDGRLDIDNAYLISENDFNKVNQRSKVDKGDILFSMIGTIGLIYLEISETIDYAIKNIGLFKTSQNPDWEIYTYLWLKSPIGRQFIDEHKSGSTQEYVKWPPLSRQQMP
jgi:type I restriction enzyme, S subunit